jgi:signal transduction histidine kinase
MEAGRERLDLQRFEPAEAIHTVVSVISPLMRGPHVELKCHLPQTTTPICSDRTKLQQILLNLLSNAVKFTDRGEIGIGLRLDSTHAHFEVWDTGIGITPAQLEKVFEPFWQAEQSRSRRAEGTGIGLSVARRLAGLLGGELLVESAVNQGTRFLLSIPVSASDTGALSDQLKIHGDILSSGASWEAES